MVAIRLRREGNKNRPFYRIVAIPHNKKRDGGFLEILGTYDPAIKDDTKKANVKLDKVDAWLSKGAKPSDTVASLIKIARKSAVVAAK